MKTCLAQPQQQRQQNDHRGVLLPCRVAPDSLSVICPLEEALKPAETLQTSAHTSAHLEHHTTGLSQMQYESHTEWQGSTDSASAKQNLHCIHCVVLQLHFVGSGIDCAIAQCCTFAQEHGMPENDFHSSVA